MFSQKCAFAQEIWLSSPDRFSSWQGGVWEETGIWQSMTEYDRYDRVWQSMTEYDNMAEYNVLQNTAE